jgi:hypothetical protein
MTKNTVVQARDVYRKQSLDEYETILNQFAHLHRIFHFKHILF